MFWSLRKPMMATVHYFESKFSSQSSKGMTFSKQTVCPLSEAFASHLSMLLVLSFNYKSISFFRGSSWPRDQTCVSWVPALAGRFFTTVPSESQVQSLSRIGLYVTPWTAACQASLSIGNSQSLLKLMSSKSVMPSNHLILCRPLLLLPSIFPSIRVFSNESVLPIRWPKYWSFSFNISPSNEYSGLISFRMEWLGLLAGQGTLKSLLQHHSSEVSILQSSVFFIVQLSHPYMTTGKTIALTRQTFVGSVFLICCLGWS